MCVYAMKGCFHAYLSFNGRLSRSLFIKGLNYHGLKISSDLLELWHCACAETRTSYRPFTKII